MVTDREHAKRYVQIRLVLSNLMWRISNFSIYRRKYTHWWNLCEIRRVANGHQALQLESTIVAESWATFDEVIDKYLSTANRIGADTDKVLRPHSKAAIVKIQELRISWLTSAEIEKEIPLIQNNSYENYHLRGNLAWKNADWKGSVFVIFEGKA